MLTVYILQYSVQCTVSSVLCTLDSIQCTAASLPCQVSSVSPSLQINIINTSGQQVVASTYSEQYAAMQYMQCSAGHLSKIQCSEDSKVHCIALQ